MSRYKPRHKRYAYEGNNQPRMIDDPWASEPKRYFNDGSTVPEANRFQMPEDHVAQFNDRQELLRQNTEINRIFGVNGFGNNAMPERNRELVFGGGDHSPGIDPWMMNDNLLTSTAAPTTQERNYPQQLMNMLQSLDDRVQSVGRSVYNNVADGFFEDGSRSQQAVRNFGNRMHKSSAGYGNDFQGRAELGLTRAAQAGGITLAGQGLINLTHALQNQFGGPADYPQESTF